ncbi:hypothetical protein EBU02_03180 [bacterium]|nr:hypothetical protein [bacterium]
MSVGGEEEGGVIKAWIERHINSAQPNERESLKSEMNAAVQKCYQEGITTGIQTSHPIERLNEIGDKATKFEALELCFEVMSANEKISPEEMNLLRTYADSLNIPKEEFERLKDFHTLNIALVEDPDKDDERQHQCHKHRRQRVVLEQCTFLQPLHHSEPTQH